MSGALRWSVAILVICHGLVHLLGAAKGLGWADVSTLGRPVGHAQGFMWLVATVLMVLTGVLVAVGRPTWWWLVATMAVVLSQAMIVTAWSDAKAGTIANVVVLVLAVYGFASLGPVGFRAEWHRDAAAIAGPTTPSVDVITESDLAALPEPLVKYLHRAGAVGRPRVENFYAEVSGRIRNGADDEWMPFTGQQFNTFGSDPRRLFFISATKAFLPVDILHVYEGGSATMRGRLLSLVPIVDASGPEMDRSETVTVFNDLVLFAPGALLDAPVSWTPVDDLNVRGDFTVGSETVTAELTFDGSGDIVDFTSEDRSRVSRNGKSFTTMRWHTPVGDRREFDGRRVVVEGDGKWYAPDPEGHYTYIEFRVDDIVYNLAEAPGW